MCGCVFHNHTKLEEQEAIERMWKFWKNGKIDENKGRLGRSESVEEKIQRWLWQEGFEVKKIGEDNSGFRYLVTKNRLPKFSVVQPKNKSDCILIESGVGFGGIDPAGLTKIFDNGQPLSWELRLHLTSKVFLYKIQPPNQQISNPGGIIFAKLIYYDELTKAKFMDTVFRVVNTAIFIILTMQRHLTTSATKITEKPGSLAYLK